MVSMIPPLFLIRRNQSLQNTDGSGRFALVETKTIRPALTFNDFLTFSLVKRPTVLLPDGDIHPRVQEVSYVGTLEIYRASSRAFATRFFKTRIEFEPFEFRSVDGHVILPILTLSNSTVVLPSEFKTIPEHGPGTPYSISIAHYSTRLASSSIPQTQTPTPSAPVSRSRPSSPPKTSALPQYLVNMVIEAAVQKGDTCPVSLEPLTKASVRLTPCGHLVSHPAAEHWLSNAHSCPVCRQDLAKEALMKWVA